MAYRLLALDCDGVLVGPDNIVPTDIAEAVRAAEAAGLKVCVATGRSFVEVLPVWRQLGLLGPQFEPLVTVGGALVAEVPSGRTLYQRGIRRELAVAFAQALAEAGYAAMAFVDGWRTDADYYITETGNIGDVDNRWFTQMNARVRRVRDLADCPDLPEPLRISAVVDPADGEALAAALRERFDGQLNLHPILAPNYGITIVEAFPPEVNKLAGVRYVAQAWRISPKQIIAVGDDVNDIPLLEGVGLGVAMAGAPDFVKATADTVATDGLAAFIHAILNGPCP